MGKVLKSHQKEPESSLDPKALDCKPLNETQKAGLKRLESKLERFQPVMFKKAPDSKRVSLNEQENPELPLQMLETTGIHDLGTGTFLINQAHMAQPEDTSTWANTSRLMHEIAPQDGLEGMLAAQMVAVHNMAMTCARRGMATDQRIEMVDRNINRVTKLMRTFTAQVEALQRYRSKGQQKITVQHVQVNQGGQAVIGDIHPGGGRP